MLFCMLAARAADLWHANGRNASELCLEQLTAPELAHYQADKQAPSFASCLYAVQAGVDMSDLDGWVLILIFVLVAIQVARDQKEQATGVLLRRHLLPYRRPPLRAAT